MIKALSEPKLETKPKLKPETKPKLETKPKPEQTPKTEPEPEPKLEIRVNKKKLKKLRKDFDGLRHKFSETEIKEYRKSFCIAKNSKSLSISEIKKTNKSLNK